MVLYFYVFLIFGYKEKSPGGKKLTGISVEIHFDLNNHFLVFKNPYCGEFSQITSLIAYVLDRFGLGLLPVGSSSTHLPIRPVVSANV